MFKKITLVIIVSVFIGGFIFLLVNSFLSDNQKMTSPLTKISKIIKSNSAPTPQPTLPPITENSNLTEEIKTLIPKDYSEEINNLKVN